MFNQRYVITTLVDPIHITSSPFGIAINPSNGDLYIATNSGVKYVNTCTPILTDIISHECTSVAVSNRNDELIVAQKESKKISRFNLTTKIQSKNLEGNYLGPFGIIENPSNGDIYIAEAHSHRIRKVSNRPPVVVAGCQKKGFNGDGNLAIKSNLNFPHSILFLPNNDLLIADTKNRRIRKVDWKTEIMSTIAGTGQQGYGGDGGPACNALFDQPCGLALDSNRNILFGLQKKYQHGST